MSHHPPAPIDVLPAAPTGCGNSPARSPHAPPGRRGHGQSQGVHPAPPRSGANPLRRGIGRWALAAALLALGACDGGGDAGDGAGASFTPGSPDAGGGGADTAPGGGATPDGPGGKPGGPDGNQPPSLYKVGSKEVAVGETLVITLKANDPDGDNLTFSVFGDLPEGAKFSKTSRQLVWTPTKAGISAFLTFVVSDGELFDRETVELTSVTEKSNHAPTFEAVGDQKLAVGVAFALQLQASDLDGDTLSFAMDGEVPPGATLDATSGLFAWTPETEHDGTTWRVHFRASDGQDEGALDVGLLVGGAAGGSPPVFKQIPSQKVGVGSTLQLEVKASDPDGDAVTFSVKGELPPGASFKPAAAVFSWTPGADAAGQAWTVTFQATDGTYVAVMAVDILVGAASAGECTADSFEPNDTSAAAAKLPVGTHSLSLCDGAKPDEDWFSINLSAGSKVVATVTFDTSQGDLDVDLYDGKTGALLTQSTGVGATESVSLASQDPRPLLLVVYGVGQETFHMAYSLDVTVTSTGGGGSCKDDDAEPNDGVADAKPLTGSTNAHICPNDVDTWRVQLACGEGLTATLTGFGAADLDLYLLDPAAPDEPLAQSVTSDPTESLTAPAVSAATERILAVAGYPAESTDAPYTLTVKTQGAACAKDVAEPNDAQAEAAPLLDGDDLQGLTACCDEDWFSIDLAAAQTLQVTVTAATPVLAEIRADGATQASKTASGPTTLSYKAKSKGTALIRIAAVAPGASYALGVALSGGAAGCTPKSCPLYTVCDATSGTCVSDYCTKNPDCPTGYSCVDTYCSEACTSDGGCRTGYACKGTLDGEVCGIDGAGQSGDPCLYLADCAGPRGCIMQDLGGYCAQVGCTSFQDCPADAECVDAPVGTQPICGRWCFGQEDCAGATTCSPWDAVDGSAVDICLP